MGWIKEMNEHCILCGVKVDAPDTEPDPADCFVPLCEPCNEASGDPANYV